VVALSARSSCALRRRVGTNGAPGAAPLANACAPFSTRTRSLRLKRIHSALVRMLPSLLCFLLLHYLRTNHITHAHARLSTSMARTAANAALLALWAPAPVKAKLQSAAACAAAQNVPVGRAVVLRVLHARARSRTAASIIERRRHRCAASYCTWWQNGCGRGSYQHGVTSAPSAASTAASARLPALR